MVPDGKRQCPKDRLTQNRAVVRYGQERFLTKAELKETTGVEIATPTWLIAVRAAEAKKATLDINPLAGEEVKKIVDELFKLTPSMRTKLAGILAPK